MASCITAAARTHAMKSTVDLNDWRNSLHDIKAEEIFELIEKAIDIAASHHPKEFIQRRERLVKMLLNSQLKSSPDEITTHTKERKNSEDVHNNGTPYKHHHNTCPANNEKSLNEDSQKPSSCSSMTENKLGFAQDLKPQNEINPKPDASESCKVTGSDATRDQHQQKANLETSKRNITDGDQQPVKRIRIKVIYSKSRNAQNQENPAASVHESSKASPQANLENSKKQNTDQKMITRNPAATVLKPSLVSLDEASLQAKLENSKRKYIDQQQERKKKKIQFIAPLSVPPEREQSKSQFKPRRKLGVLIRH